MATRLTQGHFYGKTQSHITLNGLVFAESAYVLRTDLCIPPHAHENAYFHLLVDGVCDETYGGETTTCSAATLRFHPAGEVHANRWRTSRGSVFHLEVSERRARALTELGANLDEPLQLGGGPALWLAKRVYSEFRGAGGSPLALEGLSLEMMAELFQRTRALPRQERQRPRWIYRARDLVHDRFAESLSFNEIAEEVGVHPVHLAREFRRTFGCSPGEYVRNLRLDFAARQLVMADDSLASIALSAGFSDQSHFTRLFRERTGTTPGRFRREWRTR